MKSVCIIGAGPAGLVAAKTLLQNGHFNVTVFEKKDRIGGIWAIDKHTADGFLSPETPTNLSRFTVGFSDLDWNSVDWLSPLQADVENGFHRKAAAPMFPKAWQVNRYLETYRKRYIPDDVIRLNHEVVKAQLIRPSSQENSARWKIITRDLNSHTATIEFDFVVMASGFFSRPRDIQRDVPGLEHNGINTNVRILHSSEFRRLEDLFSDTDKARGKRILMLGGGNSSGETAAAVAMQLSNHWWSPDQGHSKQYEGCKVMHVTPRPMYPLPPFNEYQAGSRSYVPLDLKLYDFSRRPNGLQSYAGKQTPEARDIVHKSLQAMVGGDQSDLGTEALVSPKGPERSTAYVALTESYPEFVRSGLIDVVAGRVSAIRDDMNGTSVSAGVQHNGEETTIGNIGAVIYATGYTPTRAIDFLAEDVKRALDYDPSSARLPLILQQWQTMNEVVPEISFLGFYEGPYWPILEMQARLTAARWTHKNSNAPIRPFETQESLLDLRRSMKAREHDVPQFWFSDYLGYMEDIASHLDLSKNNGSFAEREGCPSPARYLAKQAERDEADKIIEDLSQVWKDCVEKGRFVPRAAFRAMQGRWNISRRIESPDPSFSGTLEGEATFHPRFPTKDRSKKTFDLEYLYIESGTFTPANNGVAMTASRRYVYRYAEVDDELSVWFVKPNNDLEVDYLFHRLDFACPSASRDAGASIARAHHQCVDDMYDTEYRMPISGISLHNFQIKHVVKGPNKYYTATTKYTRP